WPPSGPRLPTLRRCTFHPALRPAIPAPHPAAPAHVVHFRFPPRLTQSLENRPNTTSALRTGALQTHHQCCAPQRVAPCPSLELSTWPDLCLAGPTSFYTPKAVSSSPVSGSFFILSTSPV